MPRKHSEAGDFVETVALADVYAVFDDVAGPVITTSDVADALGCTPDTARGKLTELQREGRVDRRKTAGRIVWWRTDTVTDPETMLKQLSQQLAEPIVVGDRVYEDGDEHMLDTDDSEEVASDE